MAELQAPASAYRDAAGWRVRLTGLTLLALRVICALVLFEHTTVRAFGFPVNPERPFRGEPAVLLCFVFLYMSAAGAGPYSVDAMLERRRAGRA